MDWQIILNIVVGVIVGVGGWFARRMFDAVDKDGKPQYQGVDTSFLVATLVSAIQELTARLELLENKQ